MMLSSAGCRGLHCSVLFKSAGAFDGHLKYVTIWRNRDIYSIALNISIRPLVYIYLLLLVYLHVSWVPTSAPNIVALFINVCACLGTGYVCPHHRNVSSRACVWPNHTDHTTGVVRWRALLSWLPQYTIGLLLRRSHAALYFIWEYHSASRFLHGKLKHFLVVFVDCFMTHVRLYIDWL